MSKEVIVTALLVIATVVAVSIFIASMLPAIYDLSDTYASITNKLSNRIGTDIRVIFIKVNSSNVTFWAKNIGYNRISASMLNLSDVFIVSSNQSYHMTFSDSRISYNIENGDGDDYWEYGETLKVSINVSLDSGEYILTFVLYNGVKTSEIFSR